MNSRIPAALSAAILFISPAAAEDTVTVAPLTAETWDMLVPSGKEVDAIYGDFVLENAQLRAVVAQPLPTRNANMTVRNVGGCLIDLTTRGHESDQLSAFFPGRRASSFGDSITGSTASAIAVVAGNTATSVHGSVQVEADATGSVPACAVEYSLGEDDSFLTVTTTWTNASDSEVALKLEDDLRADAGNEDLVKVPNGTHDLFWFHDIRWQQAYGIRAPGYRLRCNSNARESVIVYEPVSDVSAVLKPGESWTLVRQIIVARDLPGVLAVVDQLQSETVSNPVTLQVRDAGGQPIADARIEISAAGNSRGTTVTAETGAVQVPLPDGSYTINIIVDGHAAVAKDALTIQVAGPSEFEFRLDQLQRGTVVAEIIDGRGQAIPAKVEFTGTGDTPTPNWGPVSGEFFLKNLAYTANGRFETPLRAGTYDVIVSHGPEHDAVFTKLTVQPGQRTELKAVLPRVVDTSGWVSADFHSHSSPSGDNTGSQLGRVLNLAAEHIEFAPCTEHNRVSTYDDHIAALGLHSYLATVSGMELTGSPLPLNHQNVFPMVYTPRTQDGGGPTTDGSPETQIERIALWDNRSRKMIQQNHPDIGWLFHDQDGDGIADGGFARSFEHMDVVEVHPIDPILTLEPFIMRDGKPFRNMPIFNWLQLLNQGFRIYGVVNTDAHYNFHGSGGLRLWIQSSTDDPGAIDPNEMMAASEEGRIVMSNGPYLEVAVADSAAKEWVVPGRDLNAPSRTVTARVRVQCPNWTDVDTVFVLVNGRKSDALTFTRESHPQMFGSGAVKFDKPLAVPLERDSHLIVVTGHRTEQLGPVAGPDWGKQHPAAVSNPVFVDVDGDGFRPDGDTLDSPLPVKLQP